ncbi:MAG: ABC transporter permease [Clostridia bacterium]|nr:ABC transporter permease [Clostridia bacterium]
MGFRSYLLRRVFYAVIVLFVILTFNFILFRLMPGDATKMIIDPKFTPEARAMLRKQYGLDDPPLKQYWNYITSLLRFDMGLSFSTRRPVREELAERLPNTAVLFLVTFILDMLVGISLGVYAASRRDTFADRFVVGAGLFAHAVPGFFIQLMLLLLFGYYWPILPIHGTMSAPPPDGMFLRLLDRMWHLVLPAGSLVIMGFGSWALYTRNTMLEALGQDYIITARAKGIPPRDILYHHALRSVLPPIVTIIFMSLPGAVSGAVITESIFSWYGVGKYLLDATLQMDYPAAQGAFYLIALAVIVSNFLSDIAYGLVDPRIRVGAGVSR